ncbi:hypothetical protein Daus18300_011689 [Diaporthe australafricana]|uniref:Fucose-specific lectin n=1 Tax=Diaporthe australafricana TaxID=127596 RepID=A0ABR3W5W4_9PEZI
MSNVLSESSRHESNHVPPGNDSARNPNIPQQLDDDYTQDKECCNVVELDGAAIPRGRHFSETSSAIAPQVTSTNIIWPDASSLDTTNKPAATELASAPHSRHTDLGPRRVLTLWRQMSKAVRNVLIVVVIFVIIVVVAIVLGVVLSRRDQDSHSSTPAQGTSKLAALAFRNENDITDKSVFYQLSPPLTIMRARWNSSATGWTFENVSQSMVDSSSPILPKAGTPLVAVAPEAVDRDNLPDFWVDLYFMTQSNTPFQIWTRSAPQTDTSQDQQWHPESLQGNSGIFQTDFAGGTHLAGYRDYCAADECSQNSRLLYQGANKELMLASSALRTWQFWNVTNLSDDDESELRLPELEMNSSLAMTWFSPGPGVEPTGRRMYYDASHQLEEYILVNGTWTKGTFEASLGDQVPPPKVAVVAYAGVTGGSGGLDHTLLAILFQNGTIVVHWQESLDGPWQTGVALAGVNATALAVDYDLRAYSLSVGGLIQEWQIDGANPTAWTWVTNVTTTQD